MVGFTKSELKTCTLTAPLEMLLGSCLNGALVCMRLFLVWNCYDLMIVRPSECDHLARHVA